MWPSLRNPPRVPGQAVVETWSQASNASQVELVPPVTEAWPPGGAGKRPLWPPVPVHGSNEARVPVTKPGPHPPQPCLSCGMFPQACSCSLDFMSPKRWVVSKRPQVFGPPPEGKRRERRDEEKQGFDSGPQSWHEHALPEDTASPVPLAVANHAEWKEHEDFSPVKRLDLAPTVSHEISQHHGSTPKAPTTKPSALPPPPKAPSEEVAPMARPKAQAWEEVAPMARPKAQAPTTKPSALPPPPKAPSEAPTTKPSALPPPPKAPSEEVAPMARPKAQAPTTKPSALPPPPKAPSEDEDETIQEIQREMVRSLDEEEAKRIAEHLEKGEVWEDDQDDHFEAFVYQQMNDYWKVDQRSSVSKTEPFEQTMFPLPSELEADAAAEHYFWCMLGLPNMERGLKPLGPPGPPPPPAKAPPVVPKLPSPPRPTPTPPRSASRSRRKRLKPRHLKLRRRRHRSETPRPRHEEWPREKRPREERPREERQREEWPREERPAREILLEKIRGSMEDLVERNWVEEFHHHDRGRLQANMIEVLEEEEEQWPFQPIVIDFFSATPRYALVLGSLDSSYVDCHIFHWEDIPAPLACKLCLSAGKELVGMLRRFLQNKYHAKWDPSENPKAWDKHPDHQDDVMVRYIRHSHNVVNPCFEHGEHRGKLVMDLVDDLLSEKVYPEDLTPFVCIKFSNTEYWAVFGNRRLKALKAFQDRVSHDVKARCLVWSKDEVPAALACKLAMSATTTNDGQFAGFKGKGKGRAR